MFRVGSLAMMGFYKIIAALFFVCSRAIYCAWKPLHAGGKRVELVCERNKLRNYEPGDNRS